MTDLDTLARRRQALLADKETIEQALADNAAQIIAALNVGDHLDIDGTPAFKVSERKGNFDLDKAKEIVPEQLLAAATVPMLDGKALQKLMPPALVDRCRKPTTVFVSKA